MIPPETDADFAAAMEEVLAVYARPWTLSIPVCNATPETGGNSLLVKRLI